MPIYCTLNRNFTKMVVGKCYIQTFEVVIVVLLLLLLSFDVFAPQVHLPYYFMTSGLSKYT